MGALGACLDHRQEGEVVLEGIVQEAHLASPEKAEEGYHLGTRREGEESPVQVDFEEA